VAGSNYVKCIRGSRSAYDSLAIKDSNSLYFVFSDHGKDNSALYLGSELIADNGANNLDELKNVLIQSLADKDLLFYDKTSLQWKNISLETLSLEIQKHLGYDRNIFELTETGTLTLAGFKEAKEGSVLAKGPGGKTFWLDVSNHLKRTIVDSVMDIDEDALDADQYIYMVKASSDEAGKDDIYDEYMVIDGVLEKIGSWAVDLSDYATTEAMDDLKEEVAELKEAITWQNFSF
jgi:hypothetical protein